MDLETVEKKLRRNTSSQRSRRYAPLRREKFEKTNAVLPVEKQLAHRKDLEVILERKLSRSRLYTLNSIVRWFDEYLVNVFNLHEGSGKEYFHRGASKPSIALVRGFILYIIQSRSGKIHEKISFQTLAYYLQTFWVAMSYFNSRFEAAVKAAHAHWLVHLEKEQSLSRLRFEKPIAFQPDITELLAILISPAYMATFKRPIYALLLALFINLAIDTACRIGELVAGNFADTDGVQKWLKWGDARFWLRRFDDGKIRFCAVIRLQNIKGHRGDESIFKGTPLVLLPPHLAIQDSLRILTSLALVAELFQHIYSWEDIFSLQIPLGQRELEVMLKLSSANTPVFQIFPSTSKFTEHHVGQEIKRLGIAAGFKRKLTSYAFRRYAGHVLDANVSPEIRNIMFGHAASGKTFGHYRSQITNFHLQFTRLALDVQDLNFFSSCSLGQPRKSAPTSLSPAAYELIAENPDIVKIQDRISIALDSITQHYGTLENAQQAQSPLARAYNTLIAERKALFYSLAESRFKEELDLWNKSQGSQEEDSTTSSIQIVDVPALPNQEWNDESKDFAEGTGNIQEVNIEEEVSDTVISLIEDYNNLDDKSEQEVQGEVEDNQEEDEEMISLSSSLPISSNTRHLNISHRLHGCFDDEIKQTRPFIARPTIFETFQRDVFLLSQSQLGDILVNMFRMEHGLTDIPTSLLHPQFQLECSNCGKDLRVGKSSKIRMVKNAFTHLKDCARRKAEKTAKQNIVQWTSQFLGSAGLKCPMHPTTYQSCRQVYTEPEKFLSHMRKHESPISFGQSFAYRCGFTGCQVTVVDVACLRQHWADDHNMPSACDSGSLVEWCNICERFISSIRRTTDGEKQHAEQCLQSLQKIVTKVGYQIQVHNQHNVIPGSCIFCLHDPNTNRSCQDRIFSPDTTKALQDHLIDHLSSIKENVTIYCPASRVAKALQPLCSYDFKMTRTQLSEHLHKVHGYIFEEESNNTKQFTIPVTTKVFEDYVEESESETEGWRRRRKLTDYKISTTQPLTDRPPNTPTKPRTKRPRKTVDAIVEERTSG